MNLATYFHILGVFFDLVFAVYIYIFIKNGHKSTPVTQKAKFSIAANTISNVIECFNSVEDLIDWVSFTGAEEVT